MLRQRHGRTMKGQRLREFWCTELSRSGRVKLGIGLWMNLFLHKYECTVDRELWCIQRVNDVTRARRACGQPAGTAARRYGRKCLIACPYWRLCSRRFGIGDNLSPKTTTVAEIGDYSLQCGQGFRKLRHASLYLSAKIFIGLDGTKA